MSGAPMPTFQLPTMRPVTMWLRSLMAVTMRAVTPWTTLSMFWRATSLNLMVCWLRLPLMRRTGTSVGPHAHGGDRVELAGPALTDDLDAATGRREHHPILLSAVVLNG